jgi:hypothetical protein
MADLESKFQKEVADALEEALPDCIIIKGNSAYRQGVPDWLVLDGEHWAALEVKREHKAGKRPNQPYYVEKMNEMSYAAFVDPDNYQEVIGEIQSAFGRRG